MMRAFKIALLSIPLMVGAAWADKIKLENGDEIDVVVVEESESGLVVDHPDLGRIEIPSAAIKPPDPVKPGLFGSRFLRGWDRNLSAGFAGSSGNSSDTSINAALGLRGTTTGYRATFDTAYFFATKDGTRSTNSFFADYNHDFLFTSTNFFLFGRARYDYDQFQSWLHRWAGSVGFGYDFVKNSVIDFNGTLGGGFSRTFDADPDKRWRPEGVVGLKLKWRIVEGLNFEADTTYYPNFKRLPEFRWLSNAGLNLGISIVEGMSLKLGATNEYDSDVTGKNNNLKYFGNLAYAF